MENCVIIKSYVNGLRLILDPEVDFSDIILDLRSKMHNSAKFFKGSRLALDIDGRDLSEEEEKEIVRCMNVEGNIEIVCIIGKDKNKNENYIKAVRKIVPPAENDEPVLFHNGNLKSGDNLRSDKTIVLLGNAEEGSTLVSKKNVFIFGFAKGNIEAGNEMSREASFVSALSLTPSSLKISGISAGDDILKALSKRKNYKEPRMVLVKNAKICIEEITEDFFKDEKKVQD